MNTDISSFALKHLQECGPYQFNVGQVAREAKVELIEVYEVFPSVDSVIMHVLNDIHKKTIAAIDISDLDESPRDILIEITINKFEVMATYRSLLQSTYDWLLTSINLKIMKMLARQQRDLIRLSGYNSNPCQGYFQVSTLLVLQLKLANEWLFNQELTEDALMAKIDAMIDKWENITGSV